MSNEPKDPGQVALWRRGLSRRNFVRAAAGAAGAGAVLGSSHLLLPRRVFADHDDDRGFPNPIPHVTPAGPGLHFYFPGPVSGVAAPTDPTGAHAEGRDPSTIYDFCGVLGGCDVNGKATGINTVTDATTAYTYHADLRFMSGRFIGTDGDDHEGTLAFI
jgi:hypothetical protein